MSEYRFVIKRLEHPTADTIVLELCRPLQFNNPRSGLVFDFKPGQYLMLSYRDKTGRMTDRHAFSIASPPTSKESLKLGIRIGGKFTQGLSELQEGEELYVSGPFGKFVFNEKKHRDLVLIAGGIGITPFLSAMHYVTDRGLPNKLSLLYSNRTLEGTLFYDEIKQLLRINKNLSANFFVTDKTDWQIPGVYNKRITSGAMDDIIGPVRNKNFFICGPAPFMAGMKRNLEILGVEKNQIEMEEFAMLQKFEFSTALKNSAYALSVSGALILIPLYLFLNPNDASAKSGGSIFSPASPYSIENIYRISKAEYEHISNSVRDALKTKPISENISVAPEVSTIEPTSTPVKPVKSELVKKVIPAKKNVITKPIVAVKTVTTNPVKKEIVKPVQIITTVPKPTTEVSPTILAEQAAAAAAAQNQQQTQTTVPAPVTSASTPAHTTQTSNQQTTQTAQTTPAPTPVTSASQPATTAASGGTTSGNTGSTTTGGTTATTPAPVTSASQPANSGSTGSSTGSTSGGTVTPSPTPTPVPTPRRHHDDDD